MDYNWVILSKSGHFKNFELNTLSDRVFSEDSEYIKIICIGCTELKLWLFKRYSSVGYKYNIIHAYSFF